MHTQQLISAVRNTEMPKWGGNKEEFAKNKAEWKKQITELEHEWELWLAGQYAAELSRNVQILIFDMAWSDGHSNGYAEVEQKYSDLAAFVEQVIDMH
jgi:hypothetical protein